MMNNFILAALCVGFAFFPLALGNLVPMHDAMSVLGLFHYFYSQFFFYHHMAQWAPYDFYGQPTQYVQVDILSPLNYLAIVLGSVLHRTDALWLFKFTMGLEVLVFSLGLWQLSLRLYRSQLAVWLVTILGASTAIWIFQLSFNFRIYYLWPWVLLALLDFVQKKSLGNLAWVGIWLLTQLLGNLPYFAGVWLLTTVLFTGVLLSHRENRKGPVLLEGYPWMVLCVVFAAVYFLYMKGLSDGVALMSPDRLADGSISIKQFLIYGGRADLGVWLRSTLGIGPIFLWGLRDIAPFTGVLAACLCLWSMLAVGRPIARAVNAVIVVFILVMFVPLAGKIIYFFPLMKYYRHLCLLGGFVKFFIILSAGFGCDDLCRHFSGRLRGWLFVLILFGAGEILSYQWRLWQEITGVNPKVEQLQSLVDVSPTPWQDQRTYEPELLRSRQAQLLLDATERNGGSYTPDYDFMQWDACNTYRRKDMAVSGVRDLEAINPSILGVLGGCESSKLRLVGRAMAMSKQDYYRLLSWINIQMLSVVGHAPQNTAAALSEVKEKLNSFIAVPESTPLPDIQDNVAQGKVEVKSFNSNRMMVNANIGGNAGAWLMYADGYHKGWKARLDGKQVNVIEADRAFKAVWVPAGEHTIEFHFFNGAETVLSYVLMFFGCMAAVFMLTNIICIIRRIIIK